MLREMIPRYEQMEAAEKLLLLEELWSDLEQSGQLRALSPAQETDLLQRRQEYLADGLPGSAWEDVKERLSKLLP